MTKKKTNKDIKSYIITQYKNKIFNQYTLKV